MGNTSFVISLKGPSSQQIRIRNTPTEQINMLTPVSQPTAKVSVDTTDNWAERIHYIPQKGEIIVYSDRRVVDGVNYPDIKIGDGLAYVVDLPFVKGNEYEVITTTLSEHISNDEIHLLPEERTALNNKVSCRIEGETLTFESGGFNA